MAERFTVKGLFGRFDYEIGLKSGGITVLTGPNGFGKSTIFSMIASAAACDGRLKCVPFSVFGYERDGAVAAVTTNADGGFTGDERALAELIGPVRTVGSRTFFDDESDLGGGMRAYFDRVAAVPGEVARLVREGGHESRLDLYAALLSGKLAFKTAAFDGERGLYFIGADGRELAFGQLSVGEVRLAAFWYELVLCTGRGELVLIDEPESSMHVVWQLGLIDELKSVLDAVGARAIVSTHSPQILGGHRELQVDLGAQYGG